MSRTVKTSPKPVVPIAPVVQANKAKSFLVAIEDDIVAHNGRLQESLAAITTLLDQAFGPNLSSESGDEATPMPSSTASRINMHMVNQARLCDWADEVRSRLENYVG